jgi:hypothetical protein
MAGVVHGPTDIEYGITPEQQKAKQTVTQGPGPDQQTPDYIRGGFVKKVYALLVCMLVVTTAIAAPFQLLSASYVQQNRYVLQGLLLGSLFVTLCMSCCCLGCMRRFPMNYVFLAIFSVLYGVIVGVITSTYTLPSVLLAAGLTAGIFFVLTFYAMFTKTDFTGLGPYLLVALMGLIFFGFATMILGIFFPGIIPFTQVIYASVGAVLFSFFIVYDTQKIMGGNHQHSFGIDDYAFGALSLYLDIINLFMMLLSLFGNRR